MPVAAPTRIGVVIPARDEEASVGRVVAGLLDLRFGDDRAVVAAVVVCNNASTDDTAAVARSAGAMVIDQPVPGYGLACLTALAALPRVDVVLFVDADGQFDPLDAAALVSAIMSGTELVIGSRTLGQMDSGALSTPQRFGNWLATRMIALFWDHRFTDLGPFRAIRADCLALLEMNSRTFGWTVEMQVKALQAGLVCTEVPVATRRRIGRSKISGTLRGIIAAGAGIIGTIVKLWWQERPRHTIGSHQKNPAR
jgi:glycosyltransferase involved in cell wall biosynthesis